MTDQVRGVKRLRAEEKAETRSTLSTSETKKEGCHFMDKEEPGKEVSEDVTRESLIALSYSLPEKDLAPGLSPENLNSENLVEGVNVDGAEKYRSELISISYSESSDTKSVAVVQGDIKG